MRIVVVTSGTGEKSASAPNPLTVEDFRRGKAHVASRLLEHPEHQVAAETLYSGRQHRRLMGGVTAFRERWPAGSAHSLDLHILSPGYGLISGDRVVCPYDASFQGMNPSELREWSDHLDIPGAFRRALLPHFDVAFLLLGHAYVTACAIDERVVLGGCTFLFGGGRAAADLPTLTNLRLVPVGQAEAAAFRCPLFCLKGELVGGWLGHLAVAPAMVDALLAGTADPVSGWREGP